MGTSGHVMTLPSVVGSSLERDLEAGVGPRSWKRLMYNTSLHSTST